MAGFNSKKKVKSKEEKVSNRGSNKPQPRKKVNSNKPQPSKNFNVNKEEVTTLKKKVEQDVSIKELEKNSEKVEITNYIQRVENVDEKFFIHMLNQSKIKELNPFMLGKVDQSLIDSIDKYIRESKEEIVPDDVVDLTDGDRLMTLKR